ncbi:hypothetical protein [Vagococcus sp.]|uniref:hypothetical protein n=1 Tax=Vagococcus sp. TaxID=1933889 RepID=UPI003F952074
MYYWQENELVKLKRATTEEISTKFYHYLEQAREEKIFEIELAEARKMLRLLDEHPHFSSWEADYQKILATCLERRQQHPLEIKLPRSYTEAMSQHLKKSK